jgi:alpha-mannosidase
VKIHLIFNAHIDPIWLWPLQAALDEVLATCRSACDRLDAHPDLTFSRGEAWVYHQIERLDPALFRRITRYIKQGRWEIVGGWWIQPDCNLPSGFAFRRQIEEGKRYFLDRFGHFPEIAFNVDSFGHAATLPGYLRTAGQRYYIMMRPQEREMALPARLFRWRGYEGGPEVITFRIASSYTTRELNLEHIRACLEGLPKEVEDTMCFVGVGDHGGGPTERQIAWLRQHWNAFEGHTFLFSTPARYFKAVARHITW